MKYYRFTQTTTNNKTGDIKVRMFYVAAGLGSIPQGNHIEKLDHPLQRQTVSTEITKDVYDIAIKNIFK